MRNFLALLLILLSVNLSAITIKSIKYEGMVHISKPVALRMLDFEVNDNINEKILDKAIKKYFKQGYFSDVWAEFDDGNLTFHFKEKAIISKIELKGWKENDKDIMDSVIQIKRGSLYDKKKLLAAKKRIIEAISQDGKIDSVVEIEEEHLDNGSIKVTFIANEGEEIIIQSLDYSGVKKLDTDLFDEVIANKEHQFMGWFWGRNSGDMKLSDLAYDPLRIRDMYMQHGYLDAKVDEPFVRVNFDDYTAQMSYQIEEGEVYKIRKISLHQVDKVIDDAKIREIIELEEGEPFNIKTFREDAQKIKTLIADLSYAFVQVTPDLRKNKKDQTVEVVFKITPGQRVKIRNVVISGNTRTLDRIVRRELYLGPGDMYSLTDLKDSRNSLGRLGFFDGNTIEEKRIDNSTMDLVVKLKEAPTGNIQIGGGYGSYGGLLVTLAVNDRNIWGSGINMGVKVERSGKTKNYSFNISNPRLNDSDFSGNFSVYMSDIEYNDYDVSTIGAGVGTGHRFSRNISGYVGYNYSKNDYNLHDVLGVDENNETVNYYFESYSKSAITISASFDNTDDYYLPREGLTFRQSFEKSGLGGEANFFKTRTNFGKYYGLEDHIGFDAIFRYKARFYFAADTGYLPVAERFYMGGLGSVRGYESYSISPSVKEKDGTERLIGGTQTFSNSVELSLPLVPKAKMRMVVFVDWGFIGDDSLSEFSRGGYGLGLEWFSPVGPVQLMFARPLNNQPNDRTSSFEFTMGQRF
ncbi:outer membrane protein assembly factor BamA [Sulfurimonas sp.]|uniref:outer membrane protein assembly factor BamA n=1 Tax=Sulfurimonas sp. TaxID=2022749 RepID=UPI002AAFDF23|nr:outer membrane protein assembly factor BamA [Sulfurimonas sp.]